jgi:serine/threonine protein kinase
VNSNCRTLKILDFGLSKTVGTNHRISPLEKSKNYRAPEV